MGTILTKIKDQWLENSLRKQALFGEHAAVLLLFLLLLFQCCCDAFLLMFFASAVFSHCFD